MNYRVASFDWTQGGQDIGGRFAFLRSKINGYDDDSS